MKHPEAGTRIANRGMQLDGNINEAERYRPLPQGSGHGNGFSKNTTTKNRRSRRAARFQIALGLDPIVEVLPIAAAAAKVALVRLLGNLVVRRAGSLAIARNGIGRGCRHVSGRLDGPRPLL